MANRVARDIALLGNVGIRREPTMRHLAVLMASWFLVFLAVVGGTPVPTSAAQEFYFVKPVAAGSGNGTAD